MACLLSLSLFSCFRDDGIINPDDGSGKPSLGRFRGRTYNEGDTAFSSKRYGGLTNPKIALVWQFIGPKEFTYATSDGQIKDANIPFKFEFNLVNPPDKEILESPDLAVGTFWLYQDENGNGKLDRLIHPDLLAMNRAVDSIYGAYTDAQARVLEVSEIKPVRVPVTETYYIGRFGATVRILDGKPDTIWTDPDGRYLDQQLWISVLNNRFRVLNYSNRWERYFALRGRANDYYRVAAPAEGYAFAYEFPYERKLFPLPGKEAEFEARVRDATWKLIEFNARYAAMYQEEVKQGWNDYPFNGFGQPGEDWVAGRTRNYSLLYMRNMAGMDELVEAEKASSFSVTGKEKLHLGYNLVWCNDYYDCKVLDASDSIHVDLGMDEAYFNPPPTSWANPVKNPVPSGTPASWLERLQGAYMFQPDHPFSLMAAQGALWASIPDVGTFRFLPSDSLHFFARARDMQIQIVEEKGRVEKLLFYRNGKRWVALKDSTLEIPASDKDRLLAASGRKPGLARKDAMEGYFGRYDHAGDTLRIEAASGGDSMRVSVPGLVPHVYLPESDSAFFSPECDCRLSFRRNEAGKVTDAVMEREGKSALAPSFAYVSRTPADLFPDPEAKPDSAAASCDGGARDAYVWLDGKGRYKGSPDGLFLAEGDPGVSRLEHSLPWEPVSLDQGGNGLVLKLDGAKGRTAALSVLIRKDANAGKGRVRFRLTGGADPAGRERLLSDDFWVDFAGDSASVSLGAWPVDAEPFYVRLERVATPYPEFPLAFDRYEWLLSRGASADP
jgi:hypothetical protein